MRAYFLESLVEKDDYILLVDESLHHLLRVARLSTNEEVLLLNGRGLQVRTLVMNISKKEIHLKTLSVFNYERKYQFDLALCMPKRDALELCLKEATELGFENIHLIKSDFSQMKFPERERVNKLIISGVEQSNAPFSPQLFFSTWDQIPWSSYHEVLLLDSQSKRSNWTVDTIPSKKLLVVGPEGGFSLNELNYLYSQENIRPITLPTPILRTPTALAVGAGMMIQNLLN